MNIIRLQPFNHKHQEYVGIYFSNILLLNKVVKTIKGKQCIKHLNTHVLATMRQQLILKTYNPAALKTYLNEMSQLLQTICKTSTDSLTLNFLKGTWYTQLKLTENTLHSRINELKFYYEHMLEPQKNLNNKDFAKHNPPSSPTTPFINEPLAIKLFQ